MFKDVSAQKQSDGTSFLSLNEFVLTVSLSFLFVGNVTDTMATNSREEVAIVEHITMW